MKTISTAIAFGLSAAALQAATVTELVTLNSTSTVFTVTDIFEPSGFPGAASAVSGARSYTGFGSGFDDTLGTLNSVDVEYRTKYETSVNLQGDVGGFGTRDGDGTYTSTVRYTLGTSITAFFATRTGAIECNSFFASSQPDCPISLTLEGDNTTTRTYSSAQWDALSGANATPQFRISFSSTVDLLDGESLSVSSRPINNGQATSALIRYHYTPTTTTMPPVPLPAGGWALLTGVVGLAALRRRRKV